MGTLFDNLSCKMQTRFRIRFCYSSFAQSIRHGYASENIKLARPKLRPKRSLMAAIGSKKMSLGSQIRGRWPR